MANRFWICCGIALLTLVLSGGLVGCSGDEEEATETPEPTPEPTEEPTPEATEEPTEEPAAEAPNELPQALADWLATFPDDQRAATNPLSGDADAITRGGDEYQSTCFACHGKTGQGDGPAAAAMKLELTDLSDTERAALITAGERFIMMKNGIPDTAMQSFGAALSDDQIWTILAFVETLAGPPAAGAETGPPPEGG